MVEQPEGPARRPSLGRRLGVLVGGVGLVLVAAVVALGVTVSQFRDDVNVRDALIPAAGDASALSGLFVDRLEAVEGPEPVVVGGQRFQTSRQAALVLFGRLERELAGTPELHDDLARLRAEVLAWQNSVRLAAATQVDPADLAVEDPEVEALTRLVARSEDLTNGIAAAAERAAEVAGESRDRFVYAVSAALAAAVVLLAAGATALRRMVVLPLERLAGDVSRVADGDHDVALAAESSRELALLAESVARMRDRILSERDRAVRAAEAVEHQAPAVAALRTLLEPRLATPPPGIRMAGGLVPAEGVLAGDWFDLGVRDDTVVVTIGDVCGHGVESGVLAVRTKFALLDALEAGLDPAAALELAARRFGRDDTFVTAVFAEIDPRAGIVRYASAGHNPGLLLRGADEVVELPRTGPLIGLADGPRPVAEVPIGPGDVLVLYTDGVVEARDGEGIQLLVDGLLTVMGDHTDADPARLVEAVGARVLTHCGGRCTDDATMIVVRLDDADPVP